MYTEYEYLAHSGIKGMKWGIRRYRNEDGTLTEAGKKRYAKMNAKVDKMYDRKTRAAKATLQRHADMDALEKKDPEAKYWMTKDERERTKASARNTINRETELRELRKSEVEAGFNFFENRVKNSAIFGAVLGGPIGAAYAATGRGIYEELKRGSMTARQDIYDRYNRQAVVASK